MKDDYQLNLFPFTTLGRACKRLAERLAIKRRARRKIAKLPYPTEKPVHRDKPENEQERGLS